MFSYTLKILQITSTNFLSMLVLGQSNINIRTSMKPSNFRYLLLIALVIFSFQENLFAVPSQLGVIDYHSLTINTAQLNEINIYQARLPYGPFGRKITGKNVVVAVVDSGVQTFHPNISSNLLSGFNFWLNSPVTADPHGHGTHVAGIIASPQIGVAPAAKVLPITVLSPEGKGNYATIIKGVEYAIKNKARIINLSVGGYDPYGLTTSQWMAVIHKAKKANILIVAAAGNDKVNIDNIPFYPARAKADNVITVASCGIGGAFSLAFSNYGVFSVDICAPGEKILSLNDDYFNSGLLVAESGTSMAAPYVSGVAALMIEANPGLSAKKIKLIIESTVKEKVGLWGRVKTMGMLDAAQAVKGALATVATISK
jgi:subtilisin family serine protease